MRADDGVARADHDLRVGIGRAQARLELAGEAVVQALEFGLFGLGQIEIGKQPPAGDRGVADHRILDLAEPAHEPGQRRPRNAVGQQEVEVLLLGQGGDQALDCHEFCQMDWLALVAWIRLSRFCLCPPPRSPAPPSPFPNCKARLALSRAKHRSLTGHSKMSRRVARLIPFYEFDIDDFFRSDGAPAAVAAQRQDAFFGSPASTRSASPGAGR